MEFIGDRDRSTGHWGCRAEYKREESNRMKETKGHRNLHAEKFESFLNNKIACTG